MLVRVPSILLRLLVAVAGVVAGLGFFAGAAGAEELAPEGACTLEASVTAALGPDQSLPPARLVEGPEVDAAAVPGGWELDAVETGDPTTATWSVPVTTTDPRTVWVADGDRPAFPLALAPGCTPPAVAAAAVADCVAGAVVVTVSTSGQVPVDVALTGDVSESHTVAPGTEVAASTPAPEDATVLVGVTAGRAARLVSAVADCEPTPEVDATSEATATPAATPEAAAVSEPAGVPVSGEVAPTAEAPAEPVATVEVAAATVAGAGGALAVSAPSGTEGPAPLVAITEQAPAQVEPTQAQVTPENARVQSGESAAPVAGATATPPASLAFTGLESFDLVRLGAALVALGFGVERLARRGARTVGRSAHFTT